MGWCHQAQRRAMRDGQWLAVQAIREKHVWSQQVFERQARPRTVLATQNDKRRVRRRAGNGHHDLLVEVREANAAPMKRFARPRGHAMKVRALLDAAKTFELDADFN
jgi:hypothetical protein